jgi:hypothetical protein
MWQLSSLAKEFRVRRRGFQLAAKSRGSGIRGALVSIVSMSLLTTCLSAHQALAVEMGQLTIRVVDDSTGTVIPARIVLRASDGSYPGDRLAVPADRWPNIEAHGAFIAKQTTFELPIGETHVTAARGLEYQASSHTINIQRGQTATLEVRLRRLVDMRKRGWVAGDLHVHMIHGENERPTSYEEVALTCASSGLDFVSVGQEYANAGQFDLEAYEAKCRSLSSEQFTMFLGAERPKNILGHQVLICDDPFTISDEVPYFKSAAAIHARGGVCVYVHPVRYYPSKHYGGEWLDFPGNNLARELIYDAYTGPSFDGLSVLSDEPANANAHQLWFNLLNRGCFVPVFADSDACFDRRTLGLKAPGLWNTYFYIGDGNAITRQALCDAVRTGRTLATTGPLVEFRIDGQLSGSTLNPGAGEREISIDAFYPQHAFSLQSVDSKTGKPEVISRIELIRNGVVVHQWQPGIGEVHLRHRLTERERCWYVIRAYGSDQRWQVALASPIYFADEPVPSKRPPAETRVRGRIYDFVSGRDRSASVLVRRQGTILHQFDAHGPFQCNMPLDAEITVSAAGEQSITKNLLFDHAPMHRFLWYLDSDQMGKNGTLDRFEFLSREVELEFPVGYRMAGSYVVEEFEDAVSLGNIEVVEGPEPNQAGSVAIAAVITNVTQIAAGDSMDIAVVVRDEGSAEACGPYLVEGRGYDPARPTGFGALKVFDSFETQWNSSEDLGNGYKLLRGSLSVPTWVHPGPDSWIDISVRARRGHSDAASIGLAIPLGKTQHGLALSNSWPTMPLSWPDRNYGVGPFRICNRIGRKAQCLSDYRQLRLRLTCSGREFDLLPARDGQGCRDADDAMSVGHFFDQILNEESRLVP